MAIRKYIADLPAKDRDTSFVVKSTENANGDLVPPETLAARIEQIGINAQGTGSKLKSAAENVVAAFKDYIGIFNTFASVDPLHAATAVGVLNVIVDCADRYFQAESLICDRLTDIANALRYMKTFDHMYGESEAMRNALCDAYIAFLRFWDLAYRKLKQKVLQAIGKALTGGTLRRLGEIVATMKRSVKIIRREGEDIRMKMSELERIQTWFGCRACDDTANSVIGLLNKLRQDRKCEGTDTTCDWIDTNPAYVGWRDFFTSDGEQVVTPILWLQANPGTGKSTLSSYLVDTIPNHHPDAAIATYFYRFDQPCDSDPDIILKFLALRLYEKYRGLKKDLGLTQVAKIFKDLVLTTSHRDTHSGTRILELIHALIDELPRVYFILDGLDEERERKKLETLVVYLSRIVSSHPGKVHLWCSSQPDLALVALRERIAPRLLDVDTEMASTVRSYLERRVPNLPTSISQQWKARILENLLKRVEGNFMWAKLVTDELSNAKTDRKIREILEGNHSMGNYYERFFGRFIDSDRELARRIFALVAFAKRPLKIKELTDGVAMLGSKDKRSLDPEECIKDEATLLQFVSPLIIVYNHPDDTGDTKRCRLVHSTVRDFLIRPPTSSRESETLFRVESRVVSTACLLYLNQRCFSQPLTYTDGEWRDRFHVSSKNHHFLSYSAKYWDRHLDNETPPVGELRSQVETFIKSSNFITCLQVQSLWVDSHFAVFGQPGTYSKYFRRTFPRWFTEDERGQQLRSNYQRFLHDWKTVLRTRPGEVDRCWWGALGRHSFLSRHQGRYKTFCLQQAETQDEPFGGPVFQAFSPSGDKTKVLRMSPESENGNLTFTCEHWVQDVNCEPKLVSQPINTTWRATNWAAYMTRTKIRITTNKPSGPEVEDKVEWESVLPKGAPPVAFSEDCQHLRIGAQVFALSQEGKYVAVPGLDADTGARYVDEVAGRGQYVILASRKTEPPQPGADERVLQSDYILHLVKDVRDEDDDTSVESIKITLLDKDGSPIFNVGGSSPEGNSEGASAGRDDGRVDKSSGNGDPKEGSEGSEDLEDLEDLEDWKDLEDEEDDEDDDPTDEESEAHESWSECSSDGTAASQFEDENQAPWASLLGQDAESESETSESESDSCAQDPPQELDQTDSTDPSDSEEQEQTAACEEPAAGTTKIDDSGSSSEEESDAVSIEAFFDPGRAWRGDSEDEGPGYFDRDHDEYAPPFEHHYIAHGLRKKRNNRNEPQSQVFISVFDTSSASPERVFTFSPSLSFLLHDSPPAVHPTAPLVVWPLSTGDVLFANFENNSYFIRKLRPSTLNTRQVVMRFHFSHCGGYLHVASLEGQHIPSDEKGAPPKREERIPSSGKKETPPKREEIFKLSLLVATYRLCKTDLSRRPPCLIHRVKVTLGPEDSRNKLLYTMTWAPDALFFTRTNQLLKVYRVNLFNKEREPLNCKNFVRTPQEKIYLPDSAIEGKVYFFPPTVNPGGRALSARVVVSAASQAPLSSAYARDKASSPLVCFLDEAHLGVWEKSSHCEDIPKDRGVGRFDEHLEKFDADEDCDLEIYTAD